MPNKLQRIDELLRPNHFYLDQDDICFFYGEYTARKRASHSEVNQLIFNFKKSIDRRGQKDWKFKEQAIRQVANIFTSLEAWEGLKKFTWVPIPPSKSKTDPNYDGRLIQTLTLMKQHYGTFDFRELVVQKNNRVSAHGTEDRPTPKDLYDNYEIQESLVAPPPLAIIVFDDVITTGAGFKAMKQILMEQYGEIKIVGVFIARTIHSPDQNEDNAV